MLNVTIQNDESFINTMKDTLESAGCICRITNGF